MSYLCRTEPSCPLAASRAPWSIEDIGAAFVVNDGGWQKLAYVYYEEKPGRRSVAMPEREGEFEYQIKSVREPNERVVRESQLKPHLHPSSQEE